MPVHTRVHAQSCPTLFNPIDCSPPGSFVHGIFHVRILEWVVISSSNPRIKSIYPESPALSGGFFTTEPPGKPFKCQTQG